MIDIFDEQFGDREPKAQSFTQLKPAGEGRSIILSLIGKVKQSAYHWMHDRAKGYRCNGNGCPACAAGIKQSWSAVALAAAYLGNGRVQIGYVPLSRTAYNSVSKLNGGKPKECNVKLTSINGGFAFESDSGPARWTQDAAMRKAVEIAQTDTRLNALLESKLYQQLSNAEWERVVAANSGKQSVLGGGRYRNNPGASR
jgi:hypothetical protein